MTTEIFKRAISAILAAITASNGANANMSDEQDIRDYIDSSYESVAQFLCDNLETFAFEYNIEADIDEKFKATYCERKIPIYVVTTDEYGICLDFNDSNGYMIVLDDYNVIDFKINGDLDFLTDETALYSIYDGFVYKDQDGEYAIYNQQYCDNNIVCGKKAGKNSSGVIVDCNAYIKDEYGTGFTYTQKLLCSISEKNGFKNQFSCSYYEYNDESGHNNSEGNCALVATYNSFLSLKNTGKCTRFNSSTSKINIKSDKLYSKYANRIKGDDVYFVSDSVFYNKIPILYQKIRNRAVDEFGYEVGDFSHRDLEELIPWVAKKYKYTISAENDYVFSFEDNVKGEIDNGNPTIYNIAHHYPYNGHSVCILGYRIYSRTKSFLGIKFTDKVKIAIVHNGWDNKETYLDFNNTLKTGCFTRLEVKK